jgi:pimeloyl-ACP methyl ester carboxylesterase
VAVLTVDKRGTGGSSGDWNALAHDAWIADANAAFDKLLSEPGIDRQRVGLYAASEGGFIGPALAARRSDVAFVVCRVCSALPHAEAIMDDAEQRLLSSGRPASVAAEARDWLRLRTSYAVNRQGYATLAAFEARTAEAEWRQDFPPGTRALPVEDAGYWDRYAALLRGNPAAEYAALDMPVLIVLGGSDQRILAERHEPIYAALAAAKRDFTVWVLPGASHGLLIGDATGYPPALHQRMVDWVVARAFAGP